MTSDTIFVGVPVYRASAFVAETIESLLAQRYRDFHVLLSIDGEDEATERICRGYLGDPRVSMVLQPERLGWVRNTAFLHAEAIRSGASFTCIQPHDDLLHPDYLSSLHRAAQDNPRAAIVYTDIDCFGTKSGIIRQASSLGQSPYARMADMLFSHFSAVAYRGLTRVSALQSVPAISENGFGNFAIDTVWMTSLARAGELVRVPQVLYRKRLHPDSAHAKWYAWSDDRKVQAWTLHCLDMLKEGFHVTRDVAQRNHLTKIAAIRMLAKGPPISPFREQMLALPRATQESLFAEFAARAKRLHAEVS